MRAKRWLLAVLCAGMLSACATPQTAALLGEPSGLPVRAEVEHVPFHPQERDHCGPAALATVLGWSGVDAAPEDLAEKIYTPGRQGTLQTDVVAGARRHGRLVVPVDDLHDLLAEVAAGHPVLVFQNLGLEWYPQWHYAVVVGYDLDERTLTLRSGRDARRVTSFATFERTWTRGGGWAQVVLPPGRLPARGEEAELLRAAAALERTSEHLAAAEAYGAMLKRWPRSRGALLGLGNARYAAGDLEGSKAAFRTATMLHPDFGAAWNNLAHVFAELGEHEKAAGSARAALGLPGVHRTAARTTLDAVAALPH